MPGEHRQNSTQEVKGRREKCSVEKVKQEPKHGCLSPSVEGGLATEQSGRDRLENTNRRYSTPYAKESHGIKDVQHAHGQTAKKDRVERAGVGKRIRIIVGVRGGVIAHGLSSLN